MTKQSYDSYDVEVLLGWTDPTRLSLIVVITSLTGIVTEPDVSGETLPSEQTRALGELA